MSWKRARRWARTLGFRLNAWYAAVFTASAALLLALIYGLFGAAIDRKDRDVIEARVHEYAAIYRGGGEPALRAWIQRVDEARRRRTFFVRVRSADGALRLQVLPDDWTPEDVGRVEGDAAWRRVAQDEDADLTVAATRLPDGTLVEVGRSSASRPRLLQGVRRALGWAGAALLLLGVLGGALLGRRLTRPLRQLRDAVEAIIRTGRLDVRVPARRADDELDDLVRLFNRMLDGNEGLVRAVQESLDHVAHDLRTPLARLRAGVEDALRHPADDAAARHALGGALEEADRMRAIVHAILEVVRAEAGAMALERCPTDLGALVDDVVDFYEPIAQEKNITVRKDFPAPVLAPADPLRLRQAFANLLDNALRYTPPGGRIEVAGRRESGQAVVTFQDDGIGIPAAELPRIWDRLYRGDKSRSDEHGLGLGLSLVRALVQAHGGRVEATSEPGKGARFRVMLPA